MTNLLPKMFQRQFFFPFLLIACSLSALLSAYLAIIHVFSGCKRYLLAVLALANEATLH